VVVCAGGIAGMIVSSVLNHNGAAITFGLITAAAVLCSMVATAVAADVTRQLTAAAAPAPIGASLTTDPAGLSGTSEPAGPRVTEREVTVPPSIGIQRAAADDDEAQAALVETLVDGLVRAGTDEAELRELVRQSVRLGRILAVR
jgi:hypothetical protein